MQNVTAAGKDQTKKCARATIKLIGRSKIHSQHMIGPLKSLITGGKKMFVNHVGKFFRSFVSFAKWERGKEGMTRT